MGHRGLAALAALATWGCGSGGEAGCEDGLLVEVSVADANGAVLSDATVSMVLDDTTTEIPCTANGDGTYDCVVPEPGEYRVFVEPVIPSAPPFYESYGNTVLVEEPEDCAAAAATHSAIVEFEAGGA